MKTWEGWAYDENERLLRAPKAALLTGAQGAVIGALIDGAGGTVSAKVLANAIAKHTASRDPLNSVGMVVQKINTLLRLFDASGSIENVRGFGYRLTKSFPTEDAAPELALAESLKRRARVEAILVEELEATRPHARIVSRLIEEVYAR